MLCDHTVVYCITECQGHRFNPGGVISKYKCLTVLVRKAEAFSDGHVCVKLVGT
jgi:hypothetical protein